MNDALVYISAIAFLIAIFPVHVLNYVYISTENKYASANVTLYRLITILNVNTEKPPKPDVSQIDKQDKRTKKQLLYVAKKWFTVYNNLCITKIIQLGDYGLQNPNNAYVALTQNALTQTVYAFVELNGGKTKLRNYAVLNYEHGNVNYYLKLVGVINLMTFIKIITVLFLEKINER